MGSLFGRGNFDIVVRELPRGSVGANMVRIQVLACGLCGTDLHFLRHMEEYTPLGHEISARVMEVGEGVSRVRPGDLVICEDVSMCGACDACKAGRSDLCTSGFDLGGQAGMADEMIVHERMLNVFSGIDPVTAAMVEPLAVAIRGVDCLKLRPLESVAIFGMGAIGLLSAAYARLLGAGRVALIARTPGSLRNSTAEAAARDLGIDEFYYTDDENFPACALERGSFDCAVIAAPPSLAPDALALLGLGGRALTMGVSFSDDACATINLSDMVFQKKQLLTSISEPAMNFRRAIELIRSGRIDAGRIITHVLPAAEAAEGIRALYAQDSPAIKTVIRFAED